MKRTPLFVTLIVFSTLSAAAAPPNAEDSQPESTGAAGVVLKVSTRGPGMRSTPAEPLALPVPPSFDLTHVDPAQFAAALGKDPARLFAYVRDEIAYEAYAGSLRGPRGTLLAKAGNSVDRAALLAALLQNAGHTARYARGTLPEREAAELVSSMWANRPTAPAPAEPGTASPGLLAAAQTLVASTRRNYAVILEALRQADVAITPPLGLDAVIEEARAHYWVQWERDGQWVDLDPLFADAAVGRGYAPAAETFEALPDDLFHRVTIRVKVEEYTDGQPSTRELLTHTAKAADLSGVDLVLSHHPENWAGPVTDLASGLAAALADTGRIKPVLLVANESLVTGEVFQRKPGSSGGLAWLRAMLGGPAPLAAAEWVECEFAGPAMQPETVVRELFDLVGKARRAAGQRLTADEITARASSADTPNLSDTVFSLLFTTGHLDISHLPQSGETDPAQHEVAGDLRRPLRRMNVAFAIVSDSLLRQIGRRENALVVFYPDSPRLQILEISKVSDGVRMSLDLRRVDERSLTISPQPDAIVRARIFKGVLQGALERAVLDAAQNPDVKLDAGLSTSLLFDRADGEGVPILVLPRDVDRMQQASPDALARLREEAAQGFIAIAPQRAFDVAGTPRLAWWKIDARTGDTLAVTDDGLHQVQYVMRIGHTVKTLTITAAGMVWRSQTYGSAADARRAVNTLVELGSILVRIIQGGGK